ncbi:hypothetical protein [Candidatus Phytoplasma solani]|nr:hypothetical protein [Candidatus Phytoplasma solani]
MINQKQKNIFMITILIIITFLLVIYILKNPLKNDDSCLTKEYSLFDHIKTIHEKVYPELKISKKDCRYYPNCSYKELVYDDGSFFKISENGKLQQAYWRFDYQLNRNLRYDFYFFNDSEEVFKIIKACGVGTSVIRGEVVEECIVGYLINEYKPYDMFGNTKPQMLKSTYFSSETKLKSPYRTVIFQKPPNNKEKFFYRSDKVIFGVSNNQNKIKLIPFDRIDVEKNNDIIQKYSINSSLEKTELQKEIYQKLQAQDVVDIIDHYQPQQITIKIAEKGSILKLFNDNPDLCNSLDRINSFKLYNCDKIEKLENIPSDFKYTKCQHDDGSYKHQFDDGIIETYDSTGKLQSVKYEKDNLNFIYDENKKQGNGWHYNFINDSEGRLKTKIIAEEIFGS